MADEITINLRLDYLSGALSERFTASLTRTVGANNSTHIAGPAVGAGAVDRGFVGTRGYFCAVNREVSGTDVVGLGAGLGDTPLVALGAGDVCLLKMGNNGNVRWDNSTAKIEYLLAEGSSA